MSERPKFQIKRVLPKSEPILEIKEGTKMSRDRFLDYQPHQTCLEAERIQGRQRFYPNLDLWHLLRFGPTKKIRSSNRQMRFTSWKRGRFFLRAKTHLTHPRCKKGELGIRHTRTHPSLPLEGYAGFHQSTCIWKLSETKTWTLI